MSLMTAKQARSPASFVRQELAGLAAQCQGEQAVLDEQLAVVSSQLQAAGAPAPRGALREDVDILQRSAHPLHVCGTILCVGGRH